MGWVRSEARKGLRCCVLGLSAAVAVPLIAGDADADPRYYHQPYIHVVYHPRVYYRAQTEEYSPPSSSIVVDGNTGQMLEASNPDAPRHPASLTKIMTLYLLFERLDAGKIKLDTPLKVSEHAAEQDPTKLGLKPGESIAVEDAIKGVVTRSANDAAVVIAENLGGDEDEFAKLMTQKAHELGMSGTKYVNASGLPDDDQITTARDQALLGRAIQDRFPRYYGYFSTASFVFHGETIRTHDHLLGSVDGVDGIKTGFTRASGFNLVTSVHRDGRYLVAVVMGGHTAFERDAHMRELINDHIKEAALQRTAPLIAERARDDPPRALVAQAQVPVAVTQIPVASRAEAATPTTAANPRAAASSDDPIRPVPVKTTSYRIAAVQTAPLGPMPQLVPAAAPAPPPIAALQTADAQSDPPPPASQTAGQQSTPRQAELRSLASPPPAVQASPTIVASADSSATATAEPMSTAVATVEPKPQQPHARGGWLIQIGAFDGEDEAKQHLSDAQLKVHAMLGAADPFTERVQKGDKALYRARFAGFDRETAEAACRQLRHSDFECMALKD